MMESKKEEGLKSVVVTYRDGQVEVIWLNGKVEYQLAESGILMVSWETIDRSGFVTREGVARVDRKISSLMERLTEKQSNQ